jgi:hypothetical protein
MKNILGLVAVLMVILGFAERNVSIVQNPSEKILNGGGELANGED